SRRRHTRLQGDWSSDVCSSDLTVTSDSSNVVVSLGSGSGSLQGTLTRAAVNGVATFTNVRLDATGAKTLHFADGSLTATDSSSRSEERRVGKEGRTRWSPRD